MKKFNNIYQFRLLIYISILFITSYLNFINYEPGIDQIRHISWILNLLNSKTILDLSSFSDLEFLSRHNNNFFINLIKPGYSDIGHLFNIFPILLIYLIGLFAKDIVFVFNFISIMFFCLNTLIIFSIIKKNLEISNDFKSEILIFFFLSSSYYFFYSPLGIHNLSLFFYLFTIYLILFFENKSKKYSIYIICFISALGLYSHKINIILLAPSVTLYFLFKKKYKELFIYFVFNVFLFLPVLISIIFFPETLVSTKQFSQIKFSFNEYIFNILRWLKNIYITMGPIILILFVFGLVQSIVDKKKYVLIYCFLIIHFLASIFVNSFSIYYLRTNLYLNYIVLFFCLYGITYLFYKKKFIKIIALFLILIHFGFEFKRFSSLNNNNYSKHIYKDYYTNNSKIEASILKIKENYLNSNIIFLDNKIEDYFKVLSPEYYYEYNLNLKPLKNFKRNDAKNLLSHLTFVNPVILFSLTNDAFETSKTFDILKIKNKECISELTFIEKYGNVGSINENLYVYQLKCKI